MGRGETLFLADTVGFGNPEDVRRRVGAVREIYMFAGLFYFVVSYAMSLASRRLEVQLGVVDS